MARSGQQKYPGASTRYWHQDRFAGDAMESNVGLLHTTEGMSVPTYGGGASAPNLTALPDIPRKRLRWHQHFDVDVSSRALVNASGGVQTNTLNVLQVELVGTCNPAYRSRWGGQVAGRDYLFWPDAPEWALAELAKFVRWCADEHDIPMRTDVTFKAYPGSYGTRSQNKVRMTSAQWTDYRGWCGHQHAPENRHGDPGDINIARVLELARNNGGDDVALSDEDVERIAEATARKTLNLDTVDVPWESENAQNQVDNALASMWRIVYRTEAAVKDLAAAVEKLSAPAPAKTAARKPPTSAPKRAGGK